ncbi:hypothetical protein K450DRAFT_263817 [Umbelopsis ramanniana AG]|uniref:Cytidyltransferase-like domain-containing protein n=1 Tax=Umbelopsis ramanniana AG TaxID=1314678 RepID=A0AAD5H9Y3_UMBRA|nr:uncharacterized protein K450DRAFT_263817 [Umbelopsis ramanniana AG]KAI8574996.1 hypothetical protein K450DRAFT_263817 [Umbelopsis ramanniana AG]
MSTQDAAFVYFSLESIYSFNDHHKSLIEKATRETRKKLRIAVSCPALASYRNAIDAVWEPLQELLSLIYVAQLQPAYETENPLLDATAVIVELCGYEIAVDDIYERIYVLEADKETVHELNQKRSSGPLPVQLVQTTTKLVDDTSKSESINNRNARQFEQVAVGGTFDHLHAGHKILLTMTALIASKKLYCGITDDVMLAKKKHKELIASTEDRIKNVKEILRIIRKDIELCVVPITDAFGPTVTEEKIEALVVSAETMAGGNAVNTERAKLGWPPVELRVIDVISPTKTSVHGQDISALKISSTWIRNYIATDQRD